jgi:hypothetical protein
MTASRRPSLATVSPMARRTWAASVTSHGSASRAAEPALWLLREHAATCHPLAANRRTSACPIPREPPVMKTTGALMRT